MSAQTQVLGPWEVASPDTATLIAGGGGGWNWLNVVNTPTSIQDAFTGLPCDTRGFANGPFGTTVEVVFNAGVTNSAGPDLVMLDAFGGGQYLVASDHDSFVATHAVSHVAAPVIATHDFWYGQNTTSGSFSADVTGVEVDLTDLGVPQGATVYALRFTENGGGSDPIGLVKLAGGPSLAQSGAAGGVMTFDFAGFGAGETIAVVYGSGTAWAAVAPCGPVSLDLTPMNFPPVSSLIMLNADANGAAQLVQNVPAAGAGLLVQGVGVGTCGVSNSVTLP